MDNLSLMDTTSGNSIWLFATIIIVRDNAVVSVHLRVLSIYLGIPSLITLIFLMQ